MPPQGRNRLREVTILNVVLTLFNSRVSEISYGLGGRRAKVTGRSGLEYKRSLQCICRRGEGEGGGRGGGRRGRGRRGEKGGGEEEGRREGEGGEGRGGKRGLYVKKQIAGSHLQSFFFFLNHNK